MFCPWQGTLADAGDGDGEGEGGKSWDLINSSRIEKAGGLDITSGLFGNNMVSDPLEKEGLKLGDPPRYHFIADYKRRAATSAAWTACTAWQVKLLASTKVPSP